MCAAGVLGERVCVGKAVAVLRVSCRTYVSGSLQTGGESWKVNVEEYASSGFCRDVDEVVALLGFYAA